MFLFVSKAPVLKLQEIVESLNNNAINVIWNSHEYSLFYKASLDLRWCLTMTVDEKVKSVLFF